MQLTLKLYCSDMCVRFAELERKLGEIDRARALYMHASQIADPRVRTHVKISQPVAILQTSRLCSHC